MSATRIEFADISELTPAQAYEQGFLDAYRHMQLPLLRVPEYKALSEEKRNAAPGCADKPQESVAQVDETTTPDASMPSLASSKPERGFNATPEQAQLTMALMYWMDLLSDADALPQSEVAERIARDMGRESSEVVVIPRGTREFLEFTERMPSAQLERYLQRYNVVPGGEGAQQDSSLLEQLQRLQRVPEIRELERIDERTALRKPWE